MEKNPAQEEAIASIEGQVLLISCPGSGKTTTMIRRIKAMIDSGIPSADIVMVTFTEAAAAEMRARFEKNYGVSDVTFCTIHSLCLRILTEYGSGSIRIMSAEEQNYVIRRAMSVVRIPAATSIRDALCDISAYKNGTKTMSDFRPTFINWEAFRNLYSSYEAIKDEKDLSDFDDLLIQCRRLLETDAAVRAACQKRYRYIMCDEYQDTNHVQKEILYLLAGPDGNICVVGDDDQSIYGFRGADPHVMMDFEKDFPNVKSIRMDTNYRSRPEIIQAAASLIERNRERFSKDIKAARDGHGEVRYEKADDRDDEIEKIAEEIRRLTHREGQEPSSIAVLARTNLQLEGIAACFEHRGIPYTANDAIKDVYEHFIFGDIMAYLRLASGKFAASDLLQILNRPVRYLKERDFRDVDAFTDTALCDAAEQSGRSSSRVQASMLYSQVSALRGLTLSQQVAYIIEAIGYRRYIEDYVQSTEQDPNYFDGKLDFFTRDSARYKTMEEWNAAANAHIQNHRRLMRERSGKSVTLSTMHRAKGLEWDTVFLADCVKGSVPSPKAKKAEEVEEERRLFYVAVTRARERLYVMRYQTKKGRSATLTSVAPSAFIAEMQSPPAYAGRLSVSDAEKRREKARGDGASGFAEGDPRGFSAGMEVHHDSLGTGIVVSKTLFAVSIRFPSGIKVFPMGR